MKSQQPLTPRLIAEQDFTDSDADLFNSFAESELGHTVQARSRREGRESGLRAKQIRYQVDYLFTLANNAELVHRHRSTETQMKIDLFKQQTERMIQKGTAVCGTVPEPESIPASP